MMRPVCALFILVALLRPAFADDGRVLRIGVSQNPPISIQNPNGKPSGLTVDVLDALAAKRNWKLDYIQDQWTNLLQQLESGEIDILTGIAYSPERAERFDFNSEALVSNWGEVFRQKDADIASIVDLNGARVGLVPNATHSRVFVELLEQFDVQITAVAVDSYKDAFEKLDRKEVDAVVVSRLFGVLNADRRYAIGTGIVFNPIEVRFAATRGMNAEVLAAIDLFLSAQKPDPASDYHRFLTHWLNGPDHGKIPVWTYWLIGVVLAALCLAIVLVSWLRREVRVRTVKLEKSEERYELAVRQSAVWDWNLQTDSVYVSPLFHEMLGYSEAEFRAILENSIKSILHPDDQEAFSTNLSYHLHHPDRPYQNEYRWLLKSGEYRWFQMRGQYVCDAGGKAIRSVGLIVDVSERKNMERSLVGATERAQAAERRMITAIHALEDGFALFDADDCLELCNEKFKEIYKISADILIPGMKFEDILRVGVERGEYPDSEGRVEEWIAERLAIHREANFVFEQRLADGRWVNVAERRTPDDGIVGIYADITQLKAIQEQMTDAKEAAEDANNAKSEFLASMSHELRTPLNAVLGFAQMLEYDTKNPLSPSQKDYVESILAGGGLLLGLVNDVLDLARIEADQVDISLEEISANDLVRVCVELTASHAEGKGIRIHDSFSGGPPVLVRTDRLRFKQCMLNLLSNAVKYNKPNGTVTIEGYQTESGFLRLKVTDTGIGIPKASQSRVFEMFHRLGLDPMTTGDGAGIGLTVTKLLAERLAGQVGCESEEGEGSIFWLELPLASNKNAIIWTDDMSVGIDIIDSDQQALIGLLNKVNWWSVNDAEIDSHIGALVDYVHAYFTRTQTVMKVCGYAKKDEYNKRHRRFIALSEAFANEWRAVRNPETRGRLRDFLNMEMLKTFLHVDDGLAACAQGMENQIRRTLDQRAKAMPQMRSSN